VANQFDVIVLGGGPAGYVAAIRSAQLGMSTAVVEKEKLGGVCVNIGCIPTKALLHSAYIASLLREAKEFGVEAGAVKTDYGVAMQRSRRVSDQNSKGVEFLMKKNKVTVVKGAGVLQPGRKVKVGNDAYEAKKAVLIATGSRVKGLPQIGLEINKTTVISSDEALFLEQTPASMAIIGAGAVGMEFADIFHAFGTKVTLIEALPRILPLEDAEASDALTKSYKKRGIEVIAGAKVKKGTAGKDKVTLEVEASGATQKIEVATVLMAAGRAVNTEDIGLAECGVQVTERGFIKVDQNLQTTAPGYYAIGDVAGPPMLAHKGMREGVTVAELVAGKKPHPIKYDNVPSVTYCHPEVASIGLTEDQCKERKLDYVAGRFPFSANGRARGTGETEGFVKILRDKKRYGEIFGAHIVGGHASEIIHELAVARENEYTVEEVELAIHAHPTMSEAVAQAALDSLGRVVDM
jgi:dihydrolipoamide dehydrogenase